jgi:hypothetical protein
MSHQHLSLQILPSIAENVSDPDPSLDRRAMLVGTLLGLLGLADGRAPAAPINPEETAVVLPRDLKWAPWPGLPPHSGEMAKLYGDLNQKGPYLVFMKWNPGYYSAPHSYATDRLSVVLSGIWWVNSGNDFDPAHCVPVSSGGFVRRVARTPHYDGVPKDSKEPAIIALFGMGPVELKLVDPDKPGWRTV